MRKLNVMRTNNPLAQIVLDIFHNNVDTKYIEEYKKGEFCFMSVPQDHKFVDMAMDEAKANNLKTWQTNDAAVIAYYNDYIRFNLVDCDDEYAKTGDINSLDMTANVWHKIELVLKS